MLWGLPIWVWVIFFLAKVFWVAAGGILWVHFFPKVLWNKKIEEKYFGSSPVSKQIEEKVTEKV